jgi:formylglycine-generating enzyme required for sulfatase activity
MKKTIQILLSVVLCCIMAVISGCNGGSSSSDGTGNQSPTAAITSPANNSNYTYGDIVSFVGTGTDPEDGTLSSSAFVWTSNHDGIIQSSRKNFSISSLSVGTHTITLTVTDSDGGTGTASISMTISTAPSDDTFTNTLGMTFVKINPGTFWMGSPEDEPRWKIGETLHQVTLTNGYYMQTKAVTVGQWRAYVNDTGYKSQAETDGGAYKWVNNTKWERVEGVYWDNPGFYQNDSHPVTCVSWTDAWSFIDWLNSKENQAYSLPTEAQWEYAVRAGTTSRFHFGEDQDRLDDYAWHVFNSYETTHPGGEKLPNPWGLFDMYGNISEWCNDWYGALPTEPAIDPTGPSNGTLKVLRGGSFSRNPVFFGSARRATASNNYSSDDIGFRLVMHPDN